MNNLNVEIADSVILLIPKTKLKEKWRSKKINCEGKESIKDSQKRKIKENFENIRRMSEGMEKKRNRTEQFGMWTSVSFLWTSRYQNLKEARYYSISHICSKETQRNVEFSPSAYWWYALFPLKRNSLLGNMWWIHRKFLVHPVRLSSHKNG